MIFANGAISDTGFRSDAWKTKYILILANNYSLKLTGPVYLMTSKALNFLKSSFSHGHFVFKNFCDR